MVCREDNTWEFFFVYSTAKDYKVIPYNAVRDFIVNTGLFAEDIAVAAVWMHSIVTVEQAMDEDNWAGEWDAEEINQAFRDAVSDDGPMAPEQELIDERDAKSDMLPAPTMMV